MQQQWECFIGRLTYSSDIGKSKVSALFALLPLPHANKNFDRKEHVIGCHKQAASSMDKYV